jgi:hypothetical protein
MTDPLVEPPLEQIYLNITNALVSYAKAQVDDPILSMPISFELVPHQEGIGTEVLDNISWIASVHLVCKTDFESAKPALDKIWMTEGWPGPREAMRALHQKVLEDMTRLVYQIVRRHQDALESAHNAVAVLSTGKVPNAVEELASIWQKPDPEPIVPDLSDLAPFAAARAPFAAARQSTPGANEFLTIEEIEAEVEATT